MARKNLSIIVPDNNRDDGGGFAAAGISAANRTLEKQKLDMMKAQFQQQPNQQM